ncbi:MAG: hypothetical protein ACJ8AY_04605 [Gemmatimonadales bacterium]
MRFQAAIADRYQIERGGMATVYLARDLRPSLEAQAPTGSHGWRHLVQRACAAGPAPMLVGCPE